MLYLNEHIVWGKSPIQSVSCLPSFYLFFQAGVAKMQFFFYFCIENAIKMQLPAEFITQMNTLMGEDRAKRLFDGLLEEPITAVRVNGKCSGMWH